MKNLLIALSLVLASCTSVKQGNVPVADGPVARTIERVLDRTEAMSAEDGLEFDYQIQAAADIARSVLLSPEASGTMLLVSLSPLMELHDQLVVMRGMDGRFDQLEVEIYLEDTVRLRALFEAVNIHASLVAN